MNSTFLRKKKEPLLFLFLILFHLVPVWAFPFFPSQDGPVHLHHAHILKEFWLNRAAFYSQFYELNLHLDANGILQIPLAALMFFFKPLIAEKILVSGYVILLPLSFRFLIGSLRPENKFLSYLIFPLIFNFFIHMGFYDFCYSLCFYFFAIGLWFKNAESQKPFHSLLLTISLLAAYLLHRIAGLALVLTLGTLSVWFLFFDGFKLSRRRFFPLVLALVPICFWTLLIASSQKVFFIYFPGSSTLGNLLSFQPFISFSYLEMWLGKIFFLTAYSSAVLILVPKKKWGRHDGLFLAALVFLLLYFIPFEMTTPDYMGITYIHSRLCGFFCFLLFIWLADHPVPSAKIKKILILAIAGMTIALWGLRWNKYQEFNGYLSDYKIAGSVLRPQTKWIGLTYDEGFRLSGGKNISFQVSPMLHASDYLALEKDSIDLMDYQANAGNFLLKFKETVQTDTYSNPQEGKLPGFDLPRYSEASHLTIDYVFVWGLEPGAEKDFPLPDWLDRYELLSVSPLKLLRIYGLKETVPAFRRSDVRLEGQAGRSQKPTPLPG